MYSYKQIRWCLYLIVLPSPENDDDVVLLLPSACFVNPIHIDIYSTYSSSSFKTAPGHPGVTHVSPLNAIVSWLPGNSSA